MRHVLTTVWRWLTTQPEDQRHVLARAVADQDYADAERKLQLLKVRADLVKHHWQKGPPQ